jgi:hypothetical protein
MNKVLGRAVARIHADDWNKIKNDLNGFKVSFQRMSNANNVTTDILYLCVVNDEIERGKKVLASLDNPAIEIILDKNPELDCSEPVINNIPIWLHIGEKYNNCLLIDATTFNFRGAMNMNGDTDNMRNFPHISFVLMDATKSDEVVAKLRAKLSKKLSLGTQLEQFVYAVTPTESYVTDKRTRIYVYQWQTANSNPPNFSMSGTYKNYAD